jgi:hypothetical protein
MVVLVLAGMRMIVNVTIVGMSMVAPDWIAFGSCPAAQERSRSK